MERTMILKGVKDEAQRRVKEDRCPRIVYITEGANLGICLLSDWDKRPETDDALYYVWADKIESIRKGKDEV